MQRATIWFVPYSSCVILKDSSHLCSGFQGNWVKTLKALPAGRKSGQMRRLAGKMVKLLGGWNSRYAGGRLRQAEGQKETRKR